MNKSTAKNKNGTESAIGRIFFQQLLIFAVVLFFSSCLKEEKPVTPPDFSGETLTAQIPMGFRYEQQFFFDLGTNQIVGSNNKQAWDLAFECGAEGKHIILNTSKLMLVSNTGTTAFEEITSVANIEWKWDVASGNLDSTAIGEWVKWVDGNYISHRHVYLLDRGRDFDNNVLGYKKIIFDEWSADNYTIRYADLDGSNERVFQVKKDARYNFVYFSFNNNGAEVNIAPPKNEWDLWFTQYTHIFSETPENIPQQDTLIPYIVTGTLLNRNNVAVAKMFDIPFESITLELAINASFIDTKIDAIGYDWKLFNFDQVSYSIVPGRNYIIRDTDGFIYKLRFTDFYNNTGQRGYPKFEFQRL